MKLFEALWLTLGVALLLALPRLLASRDFYAVLLYFTGFTVFLVISETKVKPSLRLSPNRAGKRIYGTSRCTSFNTAWG